MHGSAPTEVCKECGMWRNARDIGAAVSKAKDSVLLLIF